VGLSRSTTTPAAPDAAVRKSQPDGPPRPAAIPDAPPPARPDARVVTAAMDAPPPAVGLVEVKITSNPSGATVTVRGERRCNTPCTLSLPARTRVTLTMPEHDSASFTVDARRPQEFMRLNPTGLRPE
jgi:hypothetical protein